ncbi:MAG: hypothetical protein AAFR01_05310 [Pseudomonadota bacterium]
MTTALIILAGLAFPPVIALRGGAPSRAFYVSLAAQALILAAMLLVFWGPAALAHGAHWAAMTVLRLRADRRARGPAAA